MSEAPPVVTIVIPCFNYARFLPAAIQSALAQTYRPIEVIVVDDGSTDGSAEVAHRYPVEVLVQSNQGSAASTNIGVRAGCGEFFVRLDADDVLYPCFVEKTLAALVANPDGALAYADGEYFGLRTGRFAFGPLELEALAHGVSATCSSLIRRSAWQAVGGLDPTIPLCEDWDLWLKFAEHGYRGVAIHEVLWGYRKHGPSLIQRRLRSWADIRREYLLIAHLQEHHSAVFAARLLVSRLLHAPLLVAAHRMSIRTFLKLLAFYTVMLVRAGVGADQPIQPAWASREDPV